jgi:hypothetical protein
MRAHMTTERPRFVGAGNEAFRCIKCGRDVPPLTSGSYRNHCPFCLWSRHVDDAPGDRLAECGGMMAPAGLEQSGKKGFVIVHRCTACGAVRRNRAATDDAVPDSWDLLIALSARHDMPQ